MKVGKMLIGGMLVVTVGILLIIGVYWLKPKLMGQVKAFRDNCKVVQMVDKIASQAEKATYPDLAGQVKKCEGKIWQERVLFDFK